MIKRTKQSLNYLKLNGLSFIRNIRLSILADKAQTAHLKKEVKCKSKWYGSSYGGFYINPDLLSEKSIIYSFGIGKDISFDLKCIKKHRCTIFGFDPTPTSVNYIRSLNLTDSFKFYDYGISLKSGHAKFFLPANPKGVSGSIILNETLNETKSIDVSMKSFKDIITKLDHQFIDVLKMDIEGAEYDVLESVLNTNVTIGQILVEFHDRLFDTDEPKSKKIVALIKQKGYGIFALSKSFEEVSFIKKKLINRL